MSNALNWFEIPVRNIDTAAAFYAKVTGQKLELATFGTMPHAVFGTQGALVVDPDRKPAGNTGVVIYLDVADGVANALDRTREAGGKVIKPVTDLGEHGAYALIEDRDGNVIGLHTNKK